MGVRRFIPDFIACTASWNYWNNGDQNQTPPTTPPSGISVVERMKQDVDYWISCGVDAISLSVSIYKDSTGSYIPKQDLNRLYEMVQYCQTVGMAINNIKIHTNASDFYESVAANVNNSTVLNNILNQYNAIVLTVCQKFQGKAPNIIVINEIEQIFCTNTTLHTFVQHNLNVAKSYGFKAGICTKNTFEWDWVTDEIKANCNFYAFNFYPFLSGKRANARLQDGFIGYYKQRVETFVTNMKAKYPGREFYLSETGCVDYWIALRKTWQWDFGADNVSANGEAQKVMFYGIFTALNYSGLDGVCIWFNFNIPRHHNLLEYYLKGDDYIEY